MSLEEEMSNPSDEEIIRILHQRLQTAKEENKKLTQQNRYLNTALGARRAGKKTFIDLAVENDYLTQQNKQMRETLNWLETLLRENYNDKENQIICVVFAYEKIQQALKEVNNEK